MTTINLDNLTDKELIEFARNVTGSDALPSLPTVPPAFRRLAKIIDDLHSEFRGVISCE